MKIEIQKDLPVSPEDFYDYMIDEIRSQIELELGREVSLEELRPGLKLRRRQTDRKGHSTSSRYTIRQNKRPEHFSALITSLAQKSLLSYRFEPSPLGCLFTYTVDIRPLDPAREPSGFKARLAELRQRSQISSSLNEALKACQKRIKERSPQKEG